MKSPPCKGFLAFFSCGGARVELSVAGDEVGKLTKYFKDGYFQGYKFTDESYERELDKDTNQFYYKCKASGILVWEHARLYVIVISWILPKLQSHGPALQPRQ